MTSADSSFSLANDLQTKNTEIAITDVSGTFTTEIVNKKRLFLCTDVCKESFVNDKKLPVLCELKIKKNGYIQGSLAHFVYLKVIRPTVSTLRLYIADEDCNIISFTSGLVRCSLLLKNEFF